MPKITLQQLTAFAQAAPGLVAAGIQIEQMIQGWWEKVHGSAMTEAQLDVILSLTVDEATRRAAMARAEAAAAQALISARAAQPA